MIALLAAFYELEPPRMEPICAATGIVASGATILPALLGIAEPVQRGAWVVAWGKQILGVLICGALIALGNWIYTLFSTQWEQAGLPLLPPMVARPGAAAGTATTTATQTVRIAPGNASGARPVESSFLDQYKD